jgi:hypothetical protein
MSTLSGTIKDRFQKDLDLIKTLRDEICVRLHLGGMDTREAFEQLEKDAEQVTRHLSQDSRRSIDDVIGRLQKIRVTLDNLARQSAQSQR